MAGLGLLLLVAFSVALAVQVWALVDASRRPEEHLADRGGKTLWVVLLAVFLVVPGGFLLGLVYLLAVRPRGARTASAADARAQAPGGDGSAQR